jgi:hypothetical protein
MNGMSLKEEFLRLLDIDKEFRYAVAGYLGIGEVLRRLEEHDRKFDEIIVELRDLRRRSEEHDRKFDEIIVELRDVRKEVSEIRAYTERTSLTLEEEAREVLYRKLKEKGIPIRLEPLIKPKIEINLYGASDDICVVGEVSTRTGVRIVNSLNEKILELTEKYPEYLRPRLLKTIYTLWATDEAIEKAREENIWMISGLAELTPIKILKLNEDNQHSRGK